MSADIYRLILKPEGDASHPRDVVESRWQKIPTMVAQSDRLYSFGEPDEHGVMELELVDQEGTLQRVEIRIPRPWVHARGPQVFAIVFMTAEWLGWPVYDPQIDDVLQKEAVLQGLVAMRQAQLEQERDSGGTS